MLYFKLKYLLFIFILLFVFISKSYTQTDPYLAFAQQMPEPIGGLGVIYKHITYPTIAKEAGISGKVYLLIYINENGGVDDVKILKGIGGGCDEAAVQGIKQIKFTPGKNNGQPVKVKLSLPITFTINN